MQVSTGFQQHAAGFEQGVIPVESSGERGVSSGGVIRVGSLFQAILDCFFNLGIPLFAV